MSTKEDVKKLWKLCFDDSDEFIEMYFRLRYSNKVNLAIKSDSETIAALQMLPYPMTFCGRTVPTSYISGACTHPNFRKKGIMYELLSQSFACMLQNGVALSTLIPAEPKLFDYYARLGYAPVFRTSAKEITISEFVSSQEIIVKKVIHFDKVIYQYLNARLSARPCCIQHTRDDFKVILADLAISDGALFFAEEKGSSAGVAILHRDGNTVRIDELFADSIEVKNNILYHIKQETGCDHMILLMPSSDNAESFQLGMARIIDVKTVLQLYAAFHPEEKMQLSLFDKQLYVNNGYYYLDKGQCKFSKTKLQGIHIELCIDELTDRLLTPLHPYMSLMMN